MSSKSSGSSDFSLARSELSLTSRPDRRNPAPSCLTVYLSAESLRSESTPESPPQSVTPTSTDSKPPLLNQHHQHETRDRQQEGHMEEKQLITPRDKTWRRFKDGKRLVDFVLAYDPNDHKKPYKDRNPIKREIFETNLIAQGLELEKEENQKIHFVKIHVPKEVLCRYCEIMKMKMPIKQIPGQEYIAEQEDFIGTVKTKLGRLTRCLRLDPKYFPEKKYELTAEFNRDKNYLFNVEDENFFTESIRISVVAFILERQRFNNDHDASLDIGIERLVNDGVYTSAYPLHDGDGDEAGNERNLLLTHWAQISTWIKYQPLDNIKEYFGVKFALYFTWLGFYTHMLIPASVIGLICFAFGLITLNTNTLSNDICNPNLNITMCPQCDSICDFWKLEETCLQAKVTYLFDNNFTIIFAVFMSFWSALYLELWKRYAANITHRWGMTGYDRQAEHPRPQYLAKLIDCPKQKKNVVTHVLEPIVPFWTIRLPFTVLSFSMVILLICIVCAAVFGVVLYRMSQLTSDSLIGGSPHKAILMPCSAAVINLFLITFLNYVYDKLAVYLTEMEYRRTQSEFDDSLTLKIYLFQFINYYSSIFYIAFLKGKFVGYPAKYNRILGYRQEECSPGGCFLELFIQLAIIMIGKQAVSSIMEILIPFLMNWITKFVGTRDEAETDENDILSYNQWTEDYKLIDFGPRGLFDEYLEMILQYGFVTLFVSAFPLAPFFALLNNVLEMRLDAKKFLKYYKRPVPCRVRNIGVWFSIMDVLGKLSVISNAFMIAFSSNFIPRLVYIIVVSETNDDIGFLDHSLAFFDTADFQTRSAPISSIFSNITTCRYPEYRNPYWESKKYKRPEIYWHILAARLAFIVVFQNVVSCVMMAVQWAIPDMSLELRDQIKRESYLTSDIIIQQETFKSRGGLLDAHMASCHAHEGDDCLHCRTNKQSTGSFLDNEKKHLGNQYISETGV
ncbi:anoctamin-5-like isoform X2 [Arctopsyche grandis]|uniref:anoctamin-5-like isoform X2 n=1 Tax=Arctopsyche grandis TaxID=121162 RepID=UPI00406D831B